MANSTIKKIDVDYTGKGLRFAFARFINSKTQQVYTKNILSELPEYSYVVFIAPYAKIQSQYFPCAFEAVSSTVLNITVTKSHAHDGGEGQPINVLIAYYII